MKNFALLSSLVFLATCITAQGGGSEEIPPYAPSIGACPSQAPTVRAASSGLGTDEASWLQKRLPNVLSALPSYLNRVNVSGLDVQSYVSKLNASNVPRAAYVISGGGSTSGLGGLGVWQAFDDRYDKANSARTGGLTQLFTYVSGLSGGGYLSTTTLATNNFSSTADIVNNINFGTNFATGPTGGNTTEYIGNLFENAGAKAEFGFTIGVPDIFGQFFGVYVPEEWKYRDWSDFAALDNTSFALGAGPMPILSFSEIVPETSPNYMGIQYPGINNFNLTTYEVNPFEFGSWRGGRVQSFVPTQYLGTTMSNGTVANSSECVTGFDKVAFMQGSTANAFNFYLITAFSNDTAGGFAKRDFIAPPYDQDDPNYQLVTGIAQGFNQTNNASLWGTVPNPFLGVNSEMANVDDLFLVDGSETGQTIALWPVIQPERQVDFIVAVDGSCDAAYFWVNGTNLYDTSMVSKQGGIPFPNVPNGNTFVNQGLNTKPTFFGCEDSNEGPVVLYVPNSPWSGYSNFSFTTPNFTNTQIDLVLENWFNVATLGDGAVDTDWPSCVACGYMKKSLARMNMTVPDVCTQCFSKHCWNGTTDDTTPPAYNPLPVLQPNLTYADFNQQAQFAPVS